MKSKVILLVLVVLMGLLGGWCVHALNRFVALEEGLKQSWAQVENVYQRRFDLIPNLVATVQGYAIHERETLTDVTEARAKVGQVTAQGLQNAMGDPEAFAKFQAAQGALSSALSRLMVVVEKYPELKANENFLDLQRQLEGTENRITVERMRYNESAQKFNTSVRQLPASLVARLSGFKEKNYFQAGEGAAQAPKVKFEMPARGAP